jgi:cation diffusion facilitator CzcD-associated flavoprotein CzcO
VEIELVDVAVIGAGQAGLSTAYWLQRRGVAPFVVLDAESRPGGAWQHRWPSLRVGTTHRIHPLPGLDVPDADPARPASELMGEYFAAYEKAFELPVRRPVQVTAVRRADDRLLVAAGEQAWAARAVVNVTGTWRSPFVPHYPGIETFAGRQLHTADYRSASEFAGLHVLVVGAGASAVQLLAEIAGVARTTWVTRRPPVWREDFTEDAGRAAVALVDERVRAGLPPASVVSVTGLGLTPAVRAARDAGLLERRPMFTRITPTGVVWADGSSLDVDVLLWCTGFRASLAHLAPLHLRAPGGGIRMDGTRVVDEPRLHLVGYGPSASTIGANRAGLVAARQISTLLAASDADERRAS